MAPVRIIRRQRSLLYPTPETVEEVVSVTFSTSALPPRSVSLPPANYRDATAAELQDNPNYLVVPAGELYAAEERDAIAAAISASQVRKVDMFEA